MTELTKTAPGLTGNQLKLIALITMTIDHVGVYLLPQYTILRLIGRLSLPIYAYLIAEGCRYTRSMGKYLGLMAFLGIGCQIVYLVMMRSLYQCILITFSLSIGLIWTIRIAEKRKAWFFWLLPVAAVGAIWFLTKKLPALLPGFAIDYGFWGVLLPAIIYLGKDRKRAFFMTVLGLVLLSWGKPFQFYCLLSLPFLALYRGKRGAAKLKYLFYIYYPAHLVALYLLKKLLVG